MNKLVLTAVTAAMLWAQGALAFDVRIDGTRLQDSGVSFSFDNGTLSISTDAGSSSCPTGQVTWNGQCVDQCGTNEERLSDGECYTRCSTGQTRNPTTLQCEDVDDTPPPGGGDCENPPAGVVCGGNVPDSEMSETGRLSQTVTIPRGQTLASRFRAIAPRGRAEFDFSPAGYSKPRVDVWIASEPGGAAVSDDCALTNGYETFDLFFVQGSRDGYCSLVEGETYYLHTRQVNPDSPSAAIDRELNK